MILIARHYETRLDWLAALASFKAVVLEGLEVVLIVIAVGAGRGLIIRISQSFFTRNLGRLFLGPI